MQSVNEISLLPKGIQARIQQLNDLVNAYPNTIPVLLCAKFLGMSDEGLRRAIILGKIPGAFAEKQSGKQNYSYKIETLPFYYWQCYGSIDAEKRYAYEKFE